MASLRGKVRAAIASGENLTGLEQYRPLLDANAVDIVQVGNVWGITHFLRVATLAHAHDLPVSPVAYNANPVAHAAAAVPNLLTYEVQDLHFPVGLDVDQQFDDGGIVLGDRPGIGIVVDESQMSPADAAPPRPAATGPHIRPERAALRLVSEPDVIDDPTPRGGRTR
jgi:L-alanine-DL-glutamate epimerase-like enolase superfamily enzyme